MTRIQNPTALVIHQAGPSTSASQQPAAKTTEPPEAEPHWLAKRQRLEPLYAPEGISSPAIDKLATWTSRPRFERFYRYDHDTPDALRSILMALPRGPIKEAVSQYASAVIADTAASENGMRQAFRWICAINLTPAEDLLQIAESSTERWANRTSSLQQGQRVPLCRIETEYLEELQRTKILSGLKEASKYGPEIFGEKTTSTGSALHTEFTTNGLIRYIAIATATHNKAVVLRRLATLIDQLYESCLAGHDLRYDELAVLGVTPEFARAWSKDHAEPFEFDEAKISEADIFAITVHRMSRYYLGVLANEDDEIKPLLEAIRDFPASLASIDAQNPAQIIHVRQRFVELRKCYDLHEKEHFRGHNKYCYFWEDFRLAEVMLERLDLMRSGRDAPVRWHGTFHVSGRADHMARSGDEPRAACLSLNSITATGNQGTLFARARYGRFKVAAIEVHGHFAAHAHLELGSSQKNPILISPVQKESRGLLGFVGLYRAIYHYVSDVLGLAPDAAIYTGATLCRWEAFESAEEPPLYRDTDVIEK